MDVLSIAASGLQAAQAQLAVAANNIANVNTPNYHAQRVDLVELTGGGVGVSGTSSTGSGTDLATELTNLSQATLLYKANAAVLKTADQMFGSLLDIFDNQKNDSDGH
ncbi:MAG: flagellar basal body protein [Planctomycetota bacterium]|nr:flagellar basal body protein [Planctomycetota bacterium]